MLPTLPIPISSEEFCIRDELMVGGGGGHDNCYHLSFKLITYLAQSMHFDMKASRLRTVNIMNISLCTNLYLNVLL